MSRKCEICGKGQVSGNTVSHSNIHTKRKWNANIQTVRVNDNGTVKKMNVKGLRLYVSGLNIYTWSDVSAYDPEAGASGVVAAIYPFAKTVVGGIELTF